MTKYWSDLKAKLVKDEAFTELSDFIGQLKLQASDSKFYLTDTPSSITSQRRQVQVADPTTGVRKHILNIYDERELSGAGSFRK